MEEALLYTSKNSSAKRSYYDDDVLTTYVGTVGGGINTNFINIAGIAIPIVSFVLALIVFFAIVIRKSEPSSGFVKWLREFFNFRKMWLAGIMKFAYVFALFLITLGGIAYMFVGGSEPWLNVLIGLGIVTLGNIGVRISYEMIMLLVSMWENSRDIRNALVGVRQKVDEKKAAKGAEEPKQEAPAAPASAGPESA